MRGRKSDKGFSFFFALLRAGLWEQEALLSAYGEIDFPEVMRLAEEQSVLGLVAAGLEHVVDVRVQKKDSMPIVGLTLEQEHRNAAMNRFIGGLVDKMRGAGMCAVLVKGQGVAQCYEMALWRSSGDIDLFFDAENYEKARQKAAGLRSPGSRARRSRSPEGARAVSPSLNRNPCHRREARRHFPAF